MHPGDWSGVLRGAQQARAPGGGRSVLFVTPSSRGAVQTAALGFAQAAARRATRPVWLLDLDLRNNGLFHAVDPGKADAGNARARAFSAAFDAEPIYRSAAGGAIITKNGVQPAKLLTLNEVPGDNLMVSRFRVEALEGGQKLALSPSNAWWTAARAKTDWICVHALPLEETSSALAICADVDHVVVVVEADATPAADIAALKDEVEAAGGSVLGAVMVGLGADARRMSKWAV
ncbi:MAG: hypothetical protein AAF486_00190 [Pseudomonadota bacterium]